MSLPPGNNPQRDPPVWEAVPLPRSRGLVLHVAAIVFCGAALALLLTGVSLVPAGLPLILLLVGTLFFGGLLALLAYRLYALSQAGYWIGRAGLRLRWGLRQVALPYDAILDMAAMQDLQEPIALPRWSWPGSVVGKVAHPEFGAVEFLAARKQGLVLIGTAEQVYVISPEDPAAFLAHYQQQAERGAIQPMRAQSLAPTFVLAEAWAQRDLRRLLVAGAGLVLLLLALVGATAPGLGSVPLGFGPDGLALEPVPATQLFLLPGLNLIFYLGNLLLGLMLYRENGRADFTRLLWSASLATSGLFLAAIVILILV